jgi:hypothetical protein
MSDERTAPVLLSPNALALPRPERGGGEPSPTRAVVDARWPAIEHLAADGDAAVAILELEALAREMRTATGSEPALRRETLALARRVVYDDLVALASQHGATELGRAALARCSAWDEELRSHLEELVAQ